MNPDSTGPGLLDGRTALVTGGARGLGRAIATRFSDAGAAVVAVDLAHALDEAALPDSWQRIAVDLTADDAESVLQSLAARLPRLDVLVANAGVVPPWRRIAELERAEWDKTFAVNVRGVAISLKAFAQLLSASKRGSAILMSSLNGWRAHADQAAYTASKHAVVGLARAAALDLGRSGVRVNALAPGPVATEALVDACECARWRADRGRGGARRVRRRFSSWQTRHAPYGR